jgi:hypothetical protein
MAHRWEGENIRKGLALGWEKNNPLGAQVGLEWLVNSWVMDLWF